jgi:sulfatase maturation enzyme AslB (radical SAM superfamily)
MVRAMQVERVSIEITERCGKGCGFCYNGSNRDGATAWTDAELCAFVVDCAAHGVKAFSFGGGEPLEAPELLWPVLEVLRGMAFRSMTTNGLLLDAAIIARLVTAAIDKVHVSIHNPRDRDEVARVIAQVGELAAAGIRSGVNLLVRASQLDAARTAVAALHAAGIANTRIVYLPMRGSDTPSPRQIAGVAAGPFQSMTCLTGCGESPRFASISARRTVARCSYTVARRELADTTHAAMVAALDGLALIDCANDRLVKLSNPPLRATR